jgi:hypothetical protein
MAIYCLRPIDFNFNYELPERTINLVDYDRDTANCFI